MAVIANIPWTTGIGNIIVSEPEPGTGDILVGSDANNDLDRQQSITYRTTYGSPQKQVTQLVKQSGIYEVLEASDGVLSDASDSDLWTLKEL